MWLKFAYKSRTGTPSTYFTHVANAWAFKQLLDRLGVEFDEITDIEIDGDPATLSELRNQFKQQGRAARGATT